MMRYAAAELLLAAALAPSPSLAADGDAAGLSDFIGAEVDKPEAAVGSDITLTLRIPVECGFGGIQSPQYEAWELNSKVVEFQLPRQTGSGRRALQRVPSKFGGRTSNPRALSVQEVSSGKHFLREAQYRLKLRSPGNIPIGPFQVPCGNTLYLTPVRQVRVSGVEEALYKPVALQDISGPPAEGPAPPLSRSGGGLTVGTLPQPSAVSSPSAGAGLAEEEDDGRTRLFFIGGGVLAGAVMLLFTFAGAGRRGSSAGQQGQLPAPGAESQPADPPMPGPRLIGEKYEILGRLGEGGMGAVLLGRDTRLQRQVAVKELRQEIQASAEDRGRFLDAARVVAGLRHPNIVGINDIVEEGGHVFVVLDFVPGKALSEVIRERGRLDLPACKQLFQGICEAVDFAHRGKVLHRDLRPGNVLVAGEGSVLVTDFVLDREVKNALSRLSQADRSGCASYMAPEQHLGGDSTASDIYALGIMLYEMVAGEVPFQGQDLLAQKERLAYVALSAKFPGLPVRLDELVSAALAFNPKARPESAAVFLQRLKEV